MSILSLSFVFLFFYEAIGAPSVIQEYNYFMFYPKWESNVQTVENIILKGKVTPRPLDDESIDNIVGGDEVDIKQYPYQVAVLWKGSLFCGGSIISEEYVLTAAHCIKNSPIDMLSVRLGSNFSAEGGEVYTIAKKAIHNKYGLIRFDYDVGVLKTSKKMSINGVTTAIVKLPEAGSSMKPGDNVVVSGWGTTSEGGKPSDVLRAVSVPVVSPEECRNAYNDMNITDNMLCAAVPEGGKDACQGDSGGPAVAEDTKLQYGIVSFGFGCARAGYPGVYSAVSQFRDWIKEVTGV